MIDKNKNNYITRLIPKIEDNSWSFQEVSDRRKINSIIDERAESYSKCGIEGGGATMFDSDSFGRFFELSHKRAKRVGAVRVINRANKAGIVPLDLSLMDYESRKMFSNLSPDPEKLGIPNMNPDLRNGISSLLENSPPEKTYEIGGFYSNHRRDLRVPVLLSFGVVKQAIKEDWSRAVQIQNPKHIEFYKMMLKTFGTPYKETDNFIDYCGRPASVLSWTPKFNFTAFEKTVDRIFMQDAYSVVEKAITGDNYLVARGNAR